MDVNKQLIVAAKDILALHDNDVFVADPWNNSMETLRKAIAAAEQAQRPCQYCDGTGDVHSITGEWRGVCSCEAGQAQQAEPVAFGDDVVQYIGRWGGHCRDCADNMGICHTGLPCGDGAKAIAHVLSALAYGINNGFLPRISAQPPAVAVPDGYALVPIDPTREMLIAINWPGDPTGYRAMLAATQKGGTP